MKFSLLQGIVKDYIDSTGIYSRNLSILNFNERILSMANPFVEEFTTEEKIRFVTIVFHNLDEFIQTRLSRLDKSDDEFSICVDVIQHLYDHMEILMNELVDKTILKDTDDFKEDVKIKTVLVLNAKKKIRQLDITSQSIKDNRMLFTMYLEQHHKSSIIRMVRSYPEYYPEMMTESVSSDDAKITYHYMKAQGELVAIQKSSRQPITNFTDSWYDEDNHVVVFYVSKILLISDVVNYVARRSPVETLPSNDLPVIPREESRAFRDVFVYTLQHTGLHRDLVVYTPYISYEDFVISMIEAMTHYPVVEEIAMTIYRMEEDSPIIDFLKHAASQGIDVYVYVEVSARGNEESNMSIIQNLHDAGVHVGYRFKGYKVHAKLFVVKYREGLDEYFVEHSAFYTHISTGNYSITNAKCYTDIQTITPDRQVGEEALHFIRDILCSPEEHEAKDIIAPAIGIGPNHLRDKITELINNEIGYGEKGKIWIKCNAICDRQIVALLKEASSAGCDVRLIIRTGIGLIAEDDLAIHSKIGRFLEHERLYIFAHDGAYMSSADLMTRNLSKRIETLYRFATPESNEFLNAINYFTYAWNDRFSQEIVWEEKEIQE